MEDLKTLIDGCLKNDPQHQEQLYRRFYPAFFALCKSFFPDHHDILTALNNGMLKVFKNIHQYDASKGDFFNWAYTTVRNAALTMIRNKKPDLAAGFTKNLEEAGTSNPFQQLEWKDIYFYLDQLPANTRTVCALYYLEGFTIREIAASMDIREGTVKWHLIECRTRLKKILEQHNIKLRG